MPEDNPSQVTGESAKAIAETIHPSFYSILHRKTRNLDWNYLGLQ